jgi:hypothetical protein
MKTHRHELLGKLDERKTEHNSEEGGGNLHAHCSDHGLLGRAKLVVNRCEPKLSRDTI